LGCEYIVSLPFRSKTNRVQVEVFHLESRKELPEGKVTILDNGPHKASLLVETQISKKSWIKTTISMNAAVEGSLSMVTFDCDLEWREDMKFLKVEFPVDVLNTEVRSLLNIRLLSVN